MITRLCRNTCFSFVVILDKVKNEIKTRILFLAPQTLRYSFRIRQDIFDLLADVITILIEMPPSTWGRALEDF